MEWFWTIVAVGAAGVAARTWRTRRADDRARHDDLEAARRLAEEDVAELGRRLGNLDAAQLRLRNDDEGIRAAYDATVEGYEAARRTAAEVRGAEQLTEVTAAVAAGRTAIAALEARLADRAVADPRLVCFFDPRHGPSATDVVWNRPGHGARRVPACAQDAERLADGVPPATRLVQVGTRTAPYWTAGGAFRSYARGYFGRTPNLTWALEPETPDAAAGSAGPGTFGTGIVGSSGHFDGGGFDGSGAPS
jgi:hypothetical protein